jgi:hypothetical protein
MKGHAPYVTAVLVLATATAFVAVSWRRDRAEADLRRRENEARLAELSQQVGDLAEQVRAGRAVPPAPFAAMAQPPEVASGRPLAQVPRRDLAAPAPGASGAPEPTVAQIRDAVDAKFVADRFDPGWSRDATAKAREDTLAALPAGSRLVGVECRTSMCRVEATHRDMDAYREFMHAGLDAPKQVWDGPRMVTILRTEADGEIVSVAFLGRRGAGPIVDDDIASGAL